MEPRLAIARYVHVFTCQTLRRLPRVWINRNPCASIGVLSYPLWLTWLWLVVPAGLHATAILIIRTPAYVIIAADSKAVDSHGRPYVEPECKIRRAATFFYVPNKFVSDSASSYNLYGMVDEIAQREKSVDIVGTRLKKNIIVPLTKALLRCGMKTRWLSEKTSQVK